MAKRNRRGYSLTRDNPFVIRGCGKSRWKKERRYVKHSTIETSNTSAGGWNYF